MRAAALLPLLWGWLGPMAFMVLAHVVMMVAMLAVLVRRHRVLGTTGPARGGTTHHP